MTAKLDRKKLDGLLDEAAVKFRQTVLDLRAQNIGATRMDGIESLQAILTNRTDVSLPEPVLRDQDFIQYVYEAVCAKSEMTEAHVQNAYPYVWQRYNELVS